MLYACYIIISSFGFGVIYLRQTLFFVAFIQAELSITLEYLKSNVASFYPNHVRSASCFHTFGPRALLDRQWQPDRMTLPFLLDDKDPAQGQPMTLSVSDRWGWLCSCSPCLC